MRLLACVSCLVEPNSLGSLVNITIRHGSLFGLYEIPVVSGMTLSLGENDNFKFLTVVSSDGNGTKLIC